MIALKFGIQSNAKKQQHKITQFVVSELHFCLLTIRIVSTLLVCTMCCGSLDIFAGEMQVLKTALPLLPSHPSSFHKVSVKAKLEEVFQLCDLCSPLQQRNSKSTPVNYQVKGNVWPLMCGS